MRFSVLQRLVLSVQGLRPQLPLFVAHGDGLSSPADASARTGHYFDKMVGGLSLLYLFQELPRISQAVGNSYPHIADAFNGNHSLLGALEAPDRARFDILQALPVRTS